MSLLTAVLTVLLKGEAWWLTNSVGLFSDALESLINVSSGIFALVILRIASKPPDTLHPHGHDKAEYFFSAVEGGMVFITAISIGFAAIHRFFHPEPLEQLGFALILAAIATLLNLGVGLILLRKGRQQNSITLEANGHHLMSDVWTSVGVIIGIALVYITSWQILDPIAAICVAVHVLLVGIKLIRRSIAGLMDESLSPDQEAAIHAVLVPYLKQGIHYHALRTRQSGQRCFISFHLLVPGVWTIQQGHDLAEKIEREIAALIKNACVLSHLEPIEDKRSWEDLDLDHLHSKDGL